MKIILVRHGKTLENPEDGLSQEGIAEVKKRRIPTPDLVLSSPKKRAVQTAEILAPNMPIIQSPHLKPNGDPEEAIRFIATHTAETLLVVGHLPSLSLITSLLLLGNTSLQIAFGNAASLQIEITSSFSGPGILDIN